MGSLMAGQCASMITDIRPAAQIVDELVADAIEALRLSSDKACT